MNENLPCGKFQIFNSVLLVLTERMNSELTYYQSFLVEHYMRLDIAFYSIF